eukprot:1156184-Pelagomonas_calceolata.AAC.14
MAACSSSSGDAYHHAGVIDLIIIALASVDNWADTGSCCWQSVLINIAVAIADNPRDTGSCPWQWCTQMNDINPTSITSMAACSLSNVDDPPEAGCRPWQWAIFFRAIHRLACSAHSILRCVECKYVSTCSRLDTCRGAQVSQGGKFVQPKCAKGSAVTMETACKQLPGVDAALLWSPRSPAYILRLRHTDLQDTAL